MTSQRGRNAHGFEVPYDDSPIDSTGGEVVALAVEAQCCRMARTDCVRDVFGVILEEVVVGEKEVHRGDKAQPLAERFNLLATLTTATRDASCKSGVAGGLKSKEGEVGFSSRADNRVTSFRWETLPVVGSALRAALGGMASMLSIGY